MDLFAHWGDDCLQTCRALGAKCKRSRNQGKGSPLPIGKVFVISSVMLADHFSAMMIFPFLPFMVHDFFPEYSKEDLGSKTGYLASAYYLGNFVGSMFWGSLSDKWGRRPVLMLGIGGSIFSVLLFGFSQNFVWAVGARLLWGLLNGNLGVAKTYLSEVCDDSNMARGFAMVSVSGSIGRLLGSSLGGFLAQPASKYSAFQQPFFCKFPYITPCFLAAGYGAIVLIAACMFLEETHHKGRFKKQEDSSSSCREMINQNAESDNSDSDTATDVEMISLSDGVSNGLAENTLPLTNQIADSDVDSQSDVTTIPDSDTDLLLGTDVGVAHRARRDWVRRKIDQIRTFDLGSCAKKFLRLQRRQCLECCWCCFDNPDDNATKPQQEKDPSNSPLLIMKRIANKFLLSVWRILCLLKDRRVLLSIFLYSCLGSTTAINNELFSLLMVTDHQHGGYNMDDNEIGVIISLVAVVQLFFQLIVYSRIVKLFGYRWTFRLFVILYAMACIFLPFSNAITGPIDSNDSNITTGGSGSGWNDLWAGSGVNSTDYCGLDTSGFEGAVNENSIRRLPPLVWTVVIGAFMTLVLSRSVSMTCTMVMVNNSTLPGTRGTINGFSQSMVAILRSLGPAVAANLFYWSELNTDHGASWPLNYHFMYDFVSLVILTTLFASLFVPKTIEKKRVA